MSSTNNLRHQPTRKVRQTVQYRETLSISDEEIHNSDVDCNITVSDEEYDPEKEGYSSDSSY